jgi:hypothetical protein
MSLMRKAMKGLGAGLSAAGELGYKAKLSSDFEAQKAEILAKRDEFMARHDDRSLDKRIASAERIAGTENQTRRALQLTEREWQLQDADAKRTADAEGLAAKQDFEMKKLNREQELRKDLETFKAEHGTSTSTLIENVNFLVKAEIANSPQEAFEMLRTSVEKPEHQAILDLAGSLRSGFGYSGKDGVERSMTDATRMVRSLKGGASAVSPAGAKKNYTVGGKTFTNADIEHTARKHGITTEEVKRRLGIQ